MEHFMQKIDHFIYAVPNDQVQFCGRLSAKKCRIEISL